MKRVAIVGGGFAGALASKALEKDFQVTLIDNKTYFEFTPGVLRTIVEPEHAKRIQAEHKIYLKNSEIIFGEVTEALKDRVIVKTAEGKKTIFFDYLVICSGSDYKKPIKEKNLIATSRAESFKSYYEKLKNSKKILLIGGGLVGVELAGEIVTKYKDKEVIIVHSESELIERQNFKARKYAESFLKKRGVKIIFNERVIKNKGNLFITDKGNEIRADMAFSCTGIVPNFEFMKKNFSNLLDSRNMVRVNEFLQVDKYKNIFAAGDIAGIREEKTAQNSEKHGETAAENIKRIERGLKLKSYKSKPRLMVISLGKYCGIVTYRRFTLIGLIPGILKTLVEIRFMRKIMR